MTPLEKFNAIKTKVDQLRTRKAQAEGALESQIDRLKKDYEIESVTEAREKVDEFEIEAVEAEKEFDNALTAVETEFPDLL